MNVEVLEQAKARIGNVPVLINMVSKRVKQLNAGFRPYIKPLSLDEEKVDIALREIAAGLLIAEMDFEATAREDH